MATKAQKIRVGLFVAIAAALFVLMIIVIGGRKFWAERDNYRIVFSGSVYGLDTGAHVYINGIKVGSVTSIGLAPEDIRKVAVTVKVARGTPVRTDTRALLTFAGVTGIKEIDLRGGTPSASPLPPGSTIPQGETTLDKLQNQAELLVDQSTKLIARANQFVDNITQITRPERFAALDDIMAKSKTTADNLAASSAAVRLILGENRVAVRQSVDEIHRLAEHTSALLDHQISPLIANAGAFVGRLDNLVHENEAPLRAAMFDLRQATRSIKELAREIRQRPSRLLFSGAQRDRKLP